MLAPADAFAAGTTAEERIRHNSTDLSTSKNNLPRYEDEKDDFRLDHAVDETREELRLVGRESVVTRCKTLQANGELDVAGADDVLDLKILVIVS